MKTIEQVINFAREKAGKSKLESSEMEAEKETYNIYLSDLLEERNWLWSLGSTTNLTPTQDGSDLGYKYKYRVNSDISDVIAVNFQRANTALLDVKRALDFGYATDPVGESTSTGSSNFVFIGGVLHSDVEVEKVIFKRKMSPEIMEPSFRLLLGYTLAHHYALTPPVAQENADRIKPLKEKAHVRAARSDTRKPVDPQLEEVYYYVRTLSIESSLRY